MADTPKFHESNFIHPSALVEPGAIFGENNIIGPFALIRSGVVLGSHNTILPFSSIGAPCEIRATKSKQQTTETGPLASWTSPPLSCSLGDQNVIGEYASIHATAKIGNNCMIQTHCSVAHDCVLEDWVTICGGSRLAGHVYMMKYSTLGAEAIIHQRQVIGSYAMIGLNSNVHSHVNPGETYLGNPARAVGKNMHAINKYQISKEEMADEFLRFKRLISERFA